MGEFAGQKCGSSVGVSATGIWCHRQHEAFHITIFNQWTVDQPSYSHFSSTFPGERAGVDYSNENLQKLQLPHFRSHNSFPQHIIDDWHWK